MENSDLGKKIKLHRQAQKLSLQEVADIIGCTKSHVWELENGRSTNPSLWMIKGLANTFGYTVSGFIGEDSAKVKNGGKIRELAKQIVDLSY